MQRSVLLCGSALTSRGLFAHDCLVHDRIFAQFVRWKRKPIWLPTAKSKVFRIPQKPKIPEADYHELHRLAKNYKRYATSLTNYFMEVQEKLVSQEAQDVLQAGWENEFLRTMKINDEWNKQVAAKREERLKEERQRETERISTSLAKKKQRMAEELVQVEKEVSIVVAEAQSYITEENIDAAIDEALKTVVNHNYCIDMNGHIRWEDPTDSRPTVHNTQTEPEQMQQAQ